MVNVVGKRIGIAFSKFGVPALRARVVMSAITAPGEMRELYRSGCNRPRLLERRAVGGWLLASQAVHAAI